MRETKIVVWPDTQDWIRFWSTVEKSTKCWNWVGSKFWNSGYGVFKVKGYMRPAHRMAYQFAYGPFNPDLFICHRCDNPSCVRPDHLFVGTNSTNIMDAVKKGRHFNARKTKCPSEHVYSKENTLVYPNGHRRCRICHTIRERRRYHEGS